MKALGHILEHGLAKYIGTSGILVAQFAEMQFVVGKMCAVSLFQSKPTIT